MWSGIGAGTTFGKHCVSHSTMITLSHSFDESLKVGIGDVRISKCKCTYPGSWCSAGFDDAFAGPDGGLLPGTASAVMASNVSVASSSAVVARVILAIANWMILLCVLPFCGWDIVTLNGKNG